MSVVSAKQYKFMQGIKHGMKPNNGIGPSPEVAREFLSKTSASKKKKFAEILKKKS